MKTPTLTGWIAISGFGLSLLFVGCADPQQQAAKSLSGKGYELTVKDLLNAAAAGDLGSLELFQAAGMDIDSADASGNTALICASAAGQLAAVERILGLGADPRKVNGVGRDALISASSKGFEEVARMLLGRGADTAIRDAEGWGALSIAAYNGHAGTVSLLAGGATPAELDDALLLASFSGDAKVIDTLLGQGANINARSPESKTPLMIASEAGRLDAVRVLLQNQANPYAVDLNNQTAANLAMAAGHEEVSSLITDPEKWGASEAGREVAGEMADARGALTRGGVEETLLEGKPLSGEPERANLVRSASASSPSGEADPKAGGSATPVAATRPRAGQPDQTTPAAGGVTAPVRSANAGTVASAGAGAGDATAGTGASVAGRTVSRTEVSRQVRESAKAKPIVALNGSTIHSRRPEEAPVKEMVLAAYHEESLPLVVDGVSGSTASVRRLDQTGGSIAVEEGAVIPGTPYKVREVSPRFVSSKEGKGRMVDVSRVKVEDTRDGTTHLLVKDAAGQTSDTYAILTAPNSQYRYVVKAGDVFRTTQPEFGPKDYQVLDIRANAVVIKDLATDEVITVARDGILEP